MDKLIHSVQINVLEKNHEAIQAIKDLYHQLIPLDYSKEDIEIDHERLQGFNQKTIHSLTLKTTKHKHNIKLLNTIFTNLPDTSIRRIIDQIESRVNHEGNLYIRLDKSSLLSDTYDLIDHGDCFHIKIKLAAFPANRENYLKTSQKLLRSYLENDDEKKEEN
jgi:hypothetical protein